MAEIDDHRDTIGLLNKLNEQFYWMCFQAGIGDRAHSFIEFNGLQSKYIQMLAMAVEAGHDPRHLNEHSQVAIPVAAHDMEYLAEKLRCILGPILDSNPEAKAAFIKGLKLDRTEKTA